MTDMAVRDTRNPGHFWADNEVVDNYLPQIGAYGFAVYMLLCRHARGVHSKVAVSVMAKELAVSEPTIRKALNTLVKVKLVESNDVEHTAKTYTLLDVKSQVRGKPDLGLGVNDVDPRTKPDLPLGVNDVDPIKTNTKTSKTEKTKSPAPNGALGESPDGVMPNEKPKEPDSVVVFAKVVDDPPNPLPPEVPVVAAARPVVIGGSQTSDKQLIALANKQAKEASKTAKRSGKAKQPPTPEPEDDLETDLLKFAIWKVTGLDFRIIKSVRETARKLRKFGYAAEDVAKARQICTKTDWRWTDPKRGNPGRRMFLQDVENYIGQTKTETNEFKYAPEMELDQIIRRVRATGDFAAVMAPQDELLLDDGNDAADARPAGPKGG
jgi:hypothetical protein